MPFNKYGAKRTTIDGITFASKREAKRYAFLKLLQSAKEIRDLQLQPVFEININGAKVCKYIADFAYHDCKENRTVVEDSKGCDTPLSRLKRKLVAAIYGIEVAIV